MGGPAARAAVDCIRKIRPLELASTEIFYASKSLSQDICRKTNQSLDRVFCPDPRTRTSEGVLGSSSDRGSCSKPDPLVTLLVHVDRDLDFENISIFKHFYDAIINVNQVVNKIVMKKITRASSLKSKSFIFRLVVNNSNENNNDVYNINDENFFFRLQLTRFNEQMTTIYVANATLNNRLTVVMKNVNVLKRVELLKMTMSIEIIIDREKTIEKKKQTKKKRKKK